MIYDIKKIDRFGFMDEFEFNRKTMNLNPNEFLDFAKRNHLQKKLFLCLCYNGVRCDFTGSIILKDTIFEING